jgi:histidinol phosphatase-like enzyme (inositol monophosphatase family)
MIEAEVELRLQLAKKLARAAGELTLKYFQTDKFDVVRKQDGSPVTISDQETETYLRAEILEAFPADAIVGEEYGTSPGTSGFCWALDPIDGTKSFISGVPMYGTMVAVLDQRDPENHRAIIGAIHIPGLDEGIYAATGSGAWHYRGAGQPVRAQVSKISQLSECVFVTTDVEAFFGRDAGEPFLELAREVRFNRTWGDVYGYLLVATGRAEFMIDAELNVWDAAAVQPIIEEAGGRFTDWKNIPTCDGGDGVGSNGLVHAEVLKILNG